MGLEPACSEPTNLHGINHPVSIRRNTGYNLIGALLPMALALVTVPAYLKLIGDARYGVMAIAWMLLGYFGLFDLGLGRATAQRIAGLRNVPSPESTTVFWTAVAVNGALGLLGGAIIWPVSIYVFGHSANMDEGLRRELSSALPWFAIAVPLVTVSGVFAGALEGRSKFLELNVISMTSSALTQVLPLAVVLAFGPSLAWIVPSVIATRLVTAVALFWLCRVHVILRSGVPPSRAEAKGLVRFGGWVTVTSLVGPLMVTLDRFVIGMTMGPSSVTYYTVPFQLASRSSVLPVSLVGAIFPRMAAAGALEAERLALTALRTLVAVMTPLTLVAVLLIDPFLRVWLGGAFAENSSLTAQILLLGFWINAFARIPYVQLQATGSPDIVAKVHVAELVPYVVLLYVALRFRGLYGAAVVFSLRTLVDFALLTWATGGLRKGIATLWAPSAVLLMGFLVAVMAPAWGAIWWALASVLLALSLWQAWGIAPPEVRLAAKQVGRGSGAGPVISSRREDP